jgi:indolepyruvate ferredoxin oxidoreductase beta subunit
VDKIDFLMVGVGGQGIILASDVVAQTGLALGYDVKKSEIHGMSQRGGSVESHVRWGQRVRSPLAPMGQVDYLVAFEVLEGARWAGYLRPGGVAVLNRQRILPLAVASGTMSYPADQEVVGLLSQRGVSVEQVDGMGIAKELGNTAVASVVVLGALSRYLPFGPGAWLEAIKGRVPARYRQLNEKAFWAGREAQR